MASLRIGYIARFLAGACLMLSGQLYATTITTTSTTTWRSSSFITGGNYSILNFYPVLQSSYNTAAGISLMPSGSTTAFQFTGIDNGSYYLAGDSYQKTLASSIDAGAYIKIAFPAGGENAVLLGTTATASQPVTLSLSDGESFSIATSIFGLSASHSFSWATLSAAPGSQAVISDFWFAASSLPQDAPGSIPAPTPEPATILLACAGGALLLFGSKRTHVASEEIS